MLSAVCGVLDDYGRQYERRYVDSNLACWWENKTKLRDLLAKHPNWDEDAYAVVVNSQKQREVNMDDITTQRRRFVTMSIDLGMGLFDKKGFSDALWYLPNTKYINDEETAHQLARFVDGVKVGQKTSRALRSLCVKFGVDKHVMFNAEYAKYADALNPFTIPNLTVLSVHPCDYLQMSHGNSWSSCHSLRYGSYCGGTFSYMMDSVSMVLYTLPPDTVPDYYNEPKISRQMFHYQDGWLLQSRLYPKDDVDDCNVNRQIVQGILAECEGVPNLWKKRDDDVYETAECALHYADYQRSEYAILTSLNEEKTQMLIGHDVNCVLCGNSIDEDNDIVCVDCTDKHCVNCSRTISSDEVIWVDDEIYCNGCVGYCDGCNEYYRIDNITTMEDGRNSYCDRCFDEYAYMCDKCGVTEYLDNAYGYGDERYCESCFNEMYAYCHECGDAFSKIDMKEVDNEWYCDECAIELEEVS